MRFGFGLLLALACSVGCVHATRRVRSTEDVADERFRLPTGVRPTHYALSLELDPQRDFVRGVVIIDLTVDTPTPRLVLHGKRIEGRATIDGHVARWASDPATQTLALVVAHPLASGRHRVRIEYAAPFSDGDHGLIHVRTTRSAYAFTHFEPAYARTMFPCFDEPSFKTPFDVELVVPEGSVAVSAGRELSRAAERPGFERVRFATTPPLPTYLVSAAVGPFDSVTQPPLPPSRVRAAPLPLRVLGPLEHHDALLAVLETAARSVERLETRLGVAHPFEKLDLVVVPGDAVTGMENAGAILLGAHLFEREDAETIEQVVVHEVAHQWFGDLVTMAWWNDVWLNESLATWMEDDVLASIHPERDFAAARVDRVLDDMFFDARIESRPVRAPVETEDALSDAIHTLQYDKGAAILQMFAVGERESVDASLTRYLSAHAFANATGPEFAREVFGSRGRGLGTYLSQPGVPLVRARAVCSGNGATLELSQSRYASLGPASDEPTATWTLPVCVRYGSADGSGATACVSLDGASARHELGVCPRWIAPHADGMGYYFAAVDAGSHAQLELAWPALTDAERVHAVGALEAAFQAGSIDARAVLETVERHAQDRSPHVVVRLTALVERIERLSRGEPDLEAALRAWQSRVYADEAALTRFEPQPGESAVARRVRSARLGRLALGARDGQVRAECLRRVTAWLDGEPRALPRSVESVCLQVAAQDGDLALIDRLEAVALGARSARPALAVALGGITNPPWAARARDRWSQHDQLGDLLRAQMEGHVLRVDVLRWLDQRLRMGASRLGPFLQAISAICTPEELETVEQSFLFAVHTSAKRFVRRAFADAHQCVALRAHHLPGLRAALQGR